MLRRGWVALLAAVGLSVVIAVPAFAHPLGNFTINRFSQIQIDGNRIDVLYVIDYAEIPAFQEKQRIADDPSYLAGQVRDLGHGLVLEISARRQPLTIRDYSIAFFPGQGGLQTMRLQILLSTTVASADRQPARYRDTNYAGRLGWKEIIVLQTGSARLLSSTAPAKSVSNALRTYPQEMLTSPLNVTEVRFSFIPAFDSAGSRSIARALPGPGPLRIVSDRFAALIAPRHLSPSLFVVSALLATALGALHALSPGHGKAVMAGYLVGARGTARHAIELGLTITATHTAGVFALGIVTLYGASLITPERLYPWVTLLSGLLIVVIGGALVLSRAGTAIHGHEHGAGDRVHHASSGDHDEPPRPGRSSRILLGISSGIIPCPSALVVLLAAISLHRVGYGILLIVAFSAGLAATLTGIGLALAGGLPLLMRARSSGGQRMVRVASRFVPVASALVVTVAGLGLTAQAIPGVR